MGTHHGDEPFGEDPEIGLNTGQMANRTIGLTLEPILLEDEPFQLSEKAKEIGKHVVDHTLFGDSWHIVPKVPLDEPVIDRQGKMCRCCTAWTLFVYYFYEWMCFFMYVPAIIIMSVIRFIGWLMYYFWAVPTRTMTVYWTQPIFDGLWRCCRPPIIFGFVLMRPCAAFIIDWCGACGKGIGPCLQCCIWTAVCPWREFWRDFHKDVGENIICVQMLWKECVPCLPCWPAIPLFTRFLWVPFTFCISPQYIPCLYCPFWAPCIPALMPWCTGPCIPLSTEECLPIPAKTITDCFWPLEGATED